MKTALPFLQRKVYQLAIILALTLFAYLPTLRNGFVWDDHLFIERWGDIRSIDAVGKILQGSAPEAQGKIYRPLRGLVYLVDYRLFKDNPVGYHLQALFLHLAMTVLVYLIVSQIGQIWQIRPIWPFVAGLLFGLHPIHTETIAYVSASVESVGTLFFFLAFYLYLTKRKITSVLFAFLAFFTYELTLTLPLLIVLYELCFRRLEPIEEVGSHKSKIIQSLPYFLGVGLFLFVRIFVFHIIARTDYLAYSFYYTMLTMAKVFVRYIGLLFLPFNQSAVHNLIGNFPASMIPYDKLDPIVNQSLFDLDTIGAILVICGLIYLALRLYKRLPVISFCILWFFISLLPVSYIIPHGGAMAEKYLYIASFGFFLLICYGTNLLLPFIKQNIKPKTVDASLKGGVIGLSIIYLLLTLARSQVWRDDVTLWSDIVKKSPSNLIGNYTLAISLGARQQMNLATKYYQKAIQIAPNFWEARFNLANIYTTEQEYDKAKQEYSMVLQINPQFTPARENLDNLNTFLQSTQSSQLQGQSNSGSSKISPDLKASNTASSSSKTTVPADKKKLNFTYSYPKEWQRTEFDRGIWLKDPSGSFNIELISDTRDKKTSIEDYLKSQQTTFGSLVKEGPALVPNVDKASVRIWNDKGTQKLQLFLFKDENVVIVRVWPADSPLMKEFDGIIGSIKFSNVVFLN